MFKKYLFFTLFLISFSSSYAKNAKNQEEIHRSKQATEQFVSLNLCSDRLLMALARPEQIAAMSPYSKNPLMMLDKINQDKPTASPSLIEIMPYLDKTILVNGLFYPELVAALKKLGVKVISLNDSPQNPDELFALLTQLGEITGNQDNAKRLISQLNSQNFKINPPLNRTLILSDTGIVETHFPQYQTLLHLLGLKAIDGNLTPQNVSLEKLLLSQPNLLISLTDKQGYNSEAEWFSHPALQRFFKHRPLASIPMKYTYCFDHGVWLGAEKLYQQLKMTPKVTPKP